MFTGGFSKGFTAAIIRAVISTTVVAGLAIGLMGAPSGTTSAASDRVVSTDATDLAPVARTVTVLGATMVVDGLLERAVVALTNTQRVLAGCRPLSLNRKLRRAARKHSYVMAKHGTMSHQLPGEPRLGRRITKARYYNWRVVAENIAVGFGSATLVTRAWWGSPSHRANITNCRLREIGVGVVVQDGRLWWTQNFGRRG